MNLNLLHRYESLAFLYILPIRWTRDIPGIEFRTYNQPFMNEMGRILQIAVDQVRPYLASNGGPIIMLQVENEYTYHPNAQLGAEYVEWAVSFSENLTKTDPIPWIMCEHNPKMNTSTAIQTINGFWDEYGVDGTGWPGPKWINEKVQTFPKQPLWWTEDQAWFQGWGGGTIVRPVDQIANGILRWYSLGGTYHNFYMMYGGNNFGRHSGGSVITAYANDAPINPYGNPNNPKYNKLQQVFGVLEDYGKCLVSMKPPTPVKVTDNVTAITYSNTSVSVTFLANTGPILKLGVEYKNKKYDLAANSTIVLDKDGTLLVNSTGPGLDKEEFPDCILPGDQPKNTIAIDDSWVYYSEKAGVGGQLNTTNSSSPIEMWNITSDTTEYIWYIPTNLQGFVANTQYTLKFPDSPGPQYAYIYDISDNRLLAMGNIGNEFTFNANNYSVFPSTEYNIGILVCGMGMSNGGYTQQTYKKGIVGRVLLNGKNINTTGWISEGRLYGEYLKLYDKSAFNKVTWNSNISNGLGKTLTWWRSQFTTPSTINPNEFTSLAVDVNGAIKGFVYVNGYNLGRYWMIPTKCNGQPHGQPDITMQWDSTYCDKGLPLQRYYTLPTDYINPVGQSNDIVIIEEYGMVKPTDIKIVYCESV